MSDHPAARMHRAISALLSGLASERIGNGNPVIGRGHLLGTPEIQALSDSADAWIGDGRHGVPDEDAAGTILAAIRNIHQEIRHMSESIAQQITDATTALQGDLTTLTTGVSSLETQLAAALAGITPGDAVTQAQVDALTAVHTSLAALATSIPAPTPPAA